MSFLNIKHASVTHSSRIIDARHPLATRQCRPSPDVGAGSTLAGAVQLISSSDPFGASRIMWTKDASSMLKLHWIYGFNTLRVLGHRGIALQLVRYM